MSVFMYLANMEFRNCSEINVAFKLAEKFVCAYDVICALNFGDFILLTDVFSPKRTPKLTLQVNFSSTSLVSLPLCSNPLLHLHLS